MCLRSNSSCAPRLLGLGVFSGAQARGRQLKHLECFLYSVEGCIVPSFRASRRSINHVKTCWSLKQIASSASAGGDVVSWKARVGCLQDTKPGNFIYLFFCTHSFISLACRSPQHVKSPSSPFPLTQPPSPFPRYPPLHHWLGQSTTVYHFPHPPKPLRPLLISRPTRQPTASVLKCSLCSALQLCPRLRSGRTLLR